MPNQRTDAPYAGTNTRLHRVLRKLQNGEPISMGVIGGSVSSGHGLDQRGREYLPHQRVVLSHPRVRVATDIRSGPLNVHRRIFDYLTSKYPHPGHKFTNGAIPATGE